MPVLIGRAVERDSPHAFRPLADALFSYLRRSGPPQVPELAPFRPILGRLIPEWRLPGEPPGEVSLVVLGEAVLRVLAAVNDGAGCVLVREAISAQLLPPERVTLALSGLRAVEQTHPGLPGEWCELAAELAEAADPQRAGEWTTGD
jgi:hypothetical protein